MHLNNIAYHILAMATTIQISSDLLEMLKKRKLYDKETYEEVIWDLIEDNMELSEETKLEIDKARKEVESGNYYTHEQVKKRLGL